jgi:spermidine synthase
LFLGTQSDQISDRPSNCALSVSGTRPPFPRVRIMISGRKLHHEGRGRAWEPAVVPSTLLDTAEVPGDGGELRLLRRGAEFSIRLGHNQLMNSRVHGSEEVLAKIAISKIGDHRRPRILIGGLGMGFTLRAALRVIGAEARVVVAELVPAVVAWNRGWLAGVSDRSLVDARVSIREEDVANLIMSERSAYDAILLDVDNGPEALSRKANDRLYDLGGLAAA